MHFWWKKQQSRQQVNWKSWDCSREYSVVTLSRLWFGWLALELSMPSAEGTFGIEGEVNESIIGKSAPAINFCLQDDLWFQCSTLLLPLCLWEQDQGQVIHNLLRQTPVVTSDRPTEDVTILLTSNQWFLLLVSSGTGGEGMWEQKYFVARNLSSPGHF